MKNRPLFYLLVVIVVGATIWWLERPFAGPQDDRSRIVFFPTFDPLQVKKLQISHLMEGIILEKMGDQWTVVSDTDPPVAADPWKVGRALLALKELQGESLISRDAQNSPQLQANAIGTHVQAYDAAGQVLADIYIGKAGPDLISTAVRREGEPAVYLVKGYLTGQFPAVVDPWKQNDKVDPNKSRTASGVHASPSGQ